MVIKKARRCLWESQLAFAIYMSNASGLCQLLCGQIRGGRQGHHEGERISEQDVPSGPSCLDPKQSPHGVGLSLILASLSLRLRFSSLGLGILNPNFISGLSLGGARRCSVPGPLSSLGQRVLTAQMLQFSKRGLTPVSSEG